jgi:BirA family biotin operon repressor/biotin-[acetyl-CoA-carboxylase] ligase
MLDASEVAGRLPGERFSAIRYVAETGSTNADLLGDAARGAADGSVLIAGHQTAGRGRLDHTWDDAAERSLLLSVLVRPIFEVQHAHHLTQAMGLSALSACEEVATVEVALKWPNDLIHTGDGADRKLGGILAESRLTGANLDAVVIGIGINVADTSLLPPDVAALAVSVSELAGSPVDTGDLTVALLGALGRFCKLIETESGRTELHRLVTMRTATLGRHISAQLGSRQIEGLATALLEDGRLEVETETGVETISAADVQHVRSRV